MLPTITCSSDCNPPCDIQWKKLDNPLTNDSECVGCDYVGTDRETNAQRSINDTLVLQSIWSELYIEYSCIATWMGGLETGSVSVVFLAQKG